MARPSADHDPWTTGSSIFVTFSSESVPAAPPVPRCRIHTSSLPLRSEVIAIRVPSGL